MKVLLPIATAIIATSIFQAAADSASLNRLAERAISDPAAVEQLRAAGPAGLDALFNAYGDSVQKLQAGLAVKDSNWEKIRAAFETVAQQRDAYASHLY